MEHVAGRHINVTDNNAPPGKMLYHPFLHQQIENRTKWTEPKDKKEPYTLKIFIVLKESLHKSSTTLLTFIGVEWAVYNWTRLGVFMESQIAEYAQEKSSQYAIVPQSKDAGIGASTPITFIAEDFTFFTSSLKIILHTDLYEAYKAKEVHSMELRFKFDKSQRNFSFQRYACTEVDIFCPVDARVHIIHQSYLLKVSTHKPVEMVSDKSRKL